MEPDPAPRTGNQMEAKSQTPVDTMIGASIAGRYRITERIGGGAMGSVYKAVQIGLGRPVALKVLKKEINWSQDTVARFHREARAVSALTHPNTVKVFDFGATQSGVLFLAMEILEGEPITRKLRREGCLEMVEALSYVQQILLSISEAHAKGIIHRDLKPDNVFLARVEGQDAPVVKILDFGIAKSIEGDNKIDQFETQDGTVFGTPRYMSPEQAQGKKLDARSDLYAVGVILYEFLSGRPPFMDEDAVVVMAKHIRERAVPLRRARPDRPIPRRLEKVVEKSLHKNPVLRYQSADEFEKALAACVPEVELLGRYTGSGKFPRAMTYLLLLPTWTKASIAGGVLLALLLAYLALPGPDRGRPESSPETVPEPASLYSGPADQPAPQAGSESGNRTDDGEKAEPEKKLVSIKTKPTGARVWSDGELMGVTPFRMAINKGEVKTIRIGVPGYEEVFADVSSDDGSRLFRLFALPRPKARASRRRAARRQAARRRTKQPTPAPVPAPAPADDKPKATSASPYEKFE
jgi:serine/threonine protein kinase